MKLSDYVVDFIVKQGTKKVFLITGGAIVHVIDSVGQRKKLKGDLDYIAFQHEQAGAMAAEVFSRLSSGIGVMMATSGPGATNLITGMCGCWFDSVPSIFITGQVNTKESIDSAETHPRQVGFQETDIVAIVAPIAKFATRVTDAKDIRATLEKAYHIACSGRPGPVLIDLPVNIQVENIEPKKLKAFSSEKYDRENAKKYDSDADIAKKIKKTITLLKSAKRPVLLLGGGIRLADAQKEALALAEKLKIPVLVSWSGFDLIPHNHPLFAGHIGVYGNRAANLTVQNADLLLSIGSRLDTRQTGGRVKTFARSAKKVMVDIDRNEIKKGRGLKIDIGIAVDAKSFIGSFMKMLKGTKIPARSDWDARVRDLKKKYGGSVEGGNKGGPMNAYDFLALLSKLLPKNQVTIVDEGGHLVWTMQSFKVKEGQRVISTFGNSPMGYGLPAAIGAAAALPGKDIVCIDGDGGFQMNIQELQTVAHYKLPLKIFIINNRCMGIIKQFQDLYFESRYYATTSACGYASPDFVKVAQAYGIKALTISNLAEAGKIISRALSHKGPVLVDVRIDENQKLNPKLEFGRPIEDMAPYLDRVELKTTMVIPLLPESEKLPEKTGWVNLK